MSISERLLRIRKSAGMTQATFAKECGVSSRAYASYELGERDLPTSVVISVCKQFKINAHWLLTGDGAETVEELIPILKCAKKYAEEFRENAHHQVSDENYWEIQAHAFQYYSNHGFKNDEAFKALTVERFKNEKP